MDTQIQLLGGFSLGRHEQVSVLLREMVTDWNDCIHIYFSEYLSLLGFTRSDIHEELLM